MIESVLIANRGEIACRIIRTCRRLGIRAVAVFSEADRGALHVEMADEAQLVGPGEASRSYLRPDAIIDAAIARQVTAIHPGYGFLSEKIELAELCLHHGIRWVGPSPRCIAAMGSKAESKAIARRAGVLVVPGTEEALSAGMPERELMERAASVGYPLLIKAVSGGGGKGMRRVDAPPTFLTSLALAEREAAASFGDDRVVLEKLIARPRHLEVQLAGDGHGNVVHFFDRECSIQRKYQKIIEEAPAPNLSPIVRAKLLDAAVRLGRAIGYDSLGTVEFILEADGTDPYFLEMNTRLQVEHAVTEAITGYDLVELQLRIASGERLPVTQDQISYRGAAIEARVNAEDPSEGYRPHLGRITGYREPRHEGVRVDSGVRTGSDVTPYYDSMIAKIIACGPDRSTAIRRLERALSRFVVLGVGTNQLFLRDILRRSDFATTVVTTRFIDEAFPDGWKAPKPEKRLLALAAAASVLERRRAGKRGVGSLFSQIAMGPAPKGGEGPVPSVAEGPWFTLAGFRTLSRATYPGRSKVRVRVPGDEPATVDVIAHADGLGAEIDGRALKLRVTPDRDVLVVNDGGRVERVLYRVDGERVSLFERGRATEFEVLPLLEALSSSAGRDHGSEADLVSEMPGLITGVQVELGQAVRRNDTVIIMESMKLTYSLSAPTDGIVRAIHCAPGDTVTKGVRLVEIGPAGVSQSD